MILPQLKIKDTLIKKSPASLHSLAPLSFCAAFTIVYMYVYIFVYWLHISSLTYPKEISSEGRPCPVALPSEPCKFGCSINISWIHFFLRRNHSFFQMLRYVNSKEHISVQLVFAFAFFPLLPILIVRSLVYHHPSLTPGASYSKSLSHS